MQHSCMPYLHFIVTMSLKLLNMSRSPDSLTWQILSASGKITAKLLWNILLRLDGRALKSHLQSFIVDSPRIALDDAAYAFFCLVNVVFILRHEVSKKVDNDLSWRHMLICSWPEQIVLFVTWHTVFHDVLIRYLIWEHTAECHIATAWQNQHCLQCIVPQCQQKSPSVYRLCLHYAQQLVNSTLSTNHTHSSSSS